MADQVKDALQTTSRKWVFLFEEGSAEMRDVLGGKGAGVAQMTRAGLPVPPGFTITTEACKAYNAAGKRFPEGVWEQTLEALAWLERKTGKRLGDAGNPLLVSVRSGAKFSMPGMMDTVLNLGLNENTVLGLQRLTGSPRFAYDAYRRFVQMFGRIVLGVPGPAFDEVFEQFRAKVGAQADTDLQAQTLREVVAALKDVVRGVSGREFPADPIEQLRLAIAAVFDSWMGKRAVEYRDFHKIPHDLGTAVNVQAMVFGNMGDDSGTGVAFTRNPSTGEKVLYGEFLLNAQGEDVVAGIRTPLPIARMAEVLPEVYKQFLEIADKLERTYEDVQDLEFTIERGKLYMLQTRSGKRTAQAAVKIAVDMVGEGLISEGEALVRVEPDQVNQLLLPRFAEDAKAQARQDGSLVATGLPASPGAAVGKVVLDADSAAELGGQGEKVILVRPETSPDDVHGMIQAQGVLTSRGGMTSHAAVVARGMGKPCIVGAEALILDLRRRTFSANGLVVREGEYISIDGTTGEVFLGQIQAIPPDLREQQDLVQLLSWADKYRRLGVWANADYPRDARKAREFGAEGIGLCRTEHMFMEVDRLPLVQKMILAAPEAARLEAQADLLRREVATAPDEARRSELEARLGEATRALEKPLQAYRSALDALLPIQREDFKGILREMAGLPVIIRLLDPPLHEFLPKYEQLLAEVAELRHSPQGREDLATKEELLKAVEAMRETNPMLGLRGCRLGILFPAINEMQVRAIIEASAELAAEGVEAKAEIMIPLVGHANELRVVQEQLDSVARQVMEETGVQVEYKFGTMIEIPRAALTADEIARHAQFFSFGTNDLTQTVFGFSRDDAEGKFLGQYIERKILPENPFQVLDRDGVGKLVRVGVELGRKARPGLEIGICGEHGGDPASIAFCHEVGLDYVSASPYRVPVARLAAAQAAISSRAPELDR